MTDTQRTVRETFGGLWWEGEVAISEALREKDRNEVE